MPCSRDKNVFGRMKYLTTGTLVIHHQPRLLNVSFQDCKFSTDRLERLHSSKCQQQTLNIQRRARLSGVLSCFASRIKKRGANVAVVKPSDSPLNFNVLTQVLWQNLANLLASKQRWRRLESRGPLGESQQR